MHNKVTVGASQCDCVTRAINEGAVRVKPCLALPRIMSYDCKGNTQMRGVVSRRQWCFEPMVSVESVKPRADVTTEPSASLMLWGGAADAPPSSAVILALTST
jgi:hypothetical protein